MPDRLPRRLWCAAMLGIADGDRRNGFKVAEKASLGVFGPNRATPFHRWVTLTEGFSAQLVSLELAKAPRSAHVFDPFGGTGTTPLVAAQLGYKGSWSEVNPYLRFVAETKLAAAAALPDERREAAIVLLVAAESPPEVSPGRRSPLLEADEQRSFFPKETAARLVAWMDRLSDLEDPLARDIGRLAVASCAIASSNMKRAVDLRRRTTVELSRDRPTPNDAVPARIQEFVADLETGPLAPGSAEFVSNDARSLPTDLDPIDAIVTSPPYLNGTNYVRNTKLELLITELVAGESELGAIRTRAVTAGINNVSKRIPDPEPISTVEPVAQALDEVAYDLRIPKMVRAYFADMKQVLVELVSATKPGATLSLDIGDSRFAGIHVDTPTLLCGIAEGVGWKPDETVHLRDRVSKDGSPLCQKLLRFSRP